MCFCNFNDVLIHYGKQDDGAVNGDFTGYIQVCKRALKQYSAHSLNPNSRASKHTTIYPKAIDEVWQTRIEMELAKSAIKKMKFKNTDFAGLLDNLPKFSDLYELREVDITTFTKRILSMPKSEPLRSYTWQKRIEEAENMPTADKIRMMRNMADVVENKKLKNNILKKYTRLMSFEEAINRRLGSTASPSRRMEKRKKPDNSAFKEALPMLIHIGNKRHEVLPVLGCS